MEHTGAENSTPWIMRFVFGRNPAWTVVRILFVVLATLVTFKFVLIPIRVTGDSMLPTYKNGQVKFVNKLAYLAHDPQRGDVVAVQFVGQEVLLLKRVVALPGDTLSVRSGEIYIDGERLVEPYTKGKLRWGHRFGSMEPMKLRAGEYLVLGDNRTISEGYFKYRKEIIGKVL
jgi:signal peptidase I